MLHQKGNDITHRKKHPTPCSSFVWKTQQLWILLRRDKHHADFWSVPVTVCIIREQIFLKHPGDQSLESFNRNLNLKPPKLHNLKSDDILTFCTPWLILSLWRIRLSAQLSLSLGMHCCNVYNRQRTCVTLVKHLSIPYEGINLCYCSLFVRLYLFYVFSVESVESLQF